MNSTSLPVKHRPIDFEGLVGQDINVRFLTSLIKKGQTGRNIIFCGPYGGSKTTSLRLFARALNCLSPTSGGSPCNACDNCLRFMDGTFPDYLEVDAASNGDKDSIRKIAELAESPPLIGKYRVIGLDEVQQISKAAWDVLLKVIEEPHSDLVFLFSTTEIEKVRAAIRSRCHCLEVKLLSRGDAKAHLRKICGIEGFKYEEGALDLIVHLSGGHPRDLLKNLEQVSFLGDITVSNCSIIFNVDSVTSLFQVFSSVLEGKKEEIPAYLQGVEDPSYTLDLLKQLWAHLYYRYHLNFESIEINPAFSFIPLGEMDSVWTKLVSLCGGKLDRAVGNLTSFFQAVHVGSKVELELLLLNLHNFIHVFHFDFSKCGLYSTGDVVRTTATAASGPRPRGRQFVSSAKTSANKSVAPPTQEIEKGDCASSQKSDKIYPHTLLSLGFTKIQEGDLIFLD